MKVDELILNRIQNLLNKGNTKTHIAEVLSISISSIKRICENHKLQKIETNRIIEIECLECKSKIITRERENRKFCNSSCSALFNNRLRPKTEKIKEQKIRIKETHCVKCLQELEKHQYKYCSSKCAGGNNKKKVQKFCKNCKKECNKTYCSTECNFQLKRKVKVEQCLANTKILKRYLIDLYGAKCMECGWDKKNEHTGNVPIELEHIDGNNTNNELTNLKLLCPNCHSLTATYKGANIGKGPVSRMKRYYAGKTY